MNFIRHTLVSRLLKGSRTIAAVVLLLTGFVCGCPVAARADENWYGISQIAQNGKNVNLYVSLPDGVEAGGTETVLKGVEAGGTETVSEGAGGGWEETASDGIEAGGTETVSEGAGGGWEETASDGVEAGGTETVLEGVEAGGTETALDDMDAVAGDQLLANIFTVTINEGTELVPREASVFSALGEGTCYVFAVDISKSLTEEEMQQIQSAMLSFVDALGSEDRMQIITAGEGAEALLNKPVRKKTKLKDAIEQSIRRTADYTYLYQAIFDALETRSRYADALPERMAVVVITDGKDTSDGGVSLEGLKEKILETRVPLYVIGVKGNDSSANLEEIRALAELSGGFVISDAASGGNGSISDALEAVRGIVKESIRLTVQPTEDLFVLEECSWTVSCRSETESFTSAPYVYSLSLEEALTEIETERDTAAWEAVGGEMETGAGMQSGSEGGIDTQSGEGASLDGESGSESGADAGNGGTLEAVSEGGSESGADIGNGGTLEAVSEEGSESGVDTGSGGTLEAVSEGGSGSSVDTGSGGTLEVVSEGGNESGVEAGSGTVSEGLAGTEMGTEEGFPRFTRGSRITCIAAILIGISLIFILTSLILWKKCRDFDEQESPGESLCEDEYETLTNPGFPDNEETADFPTAFDDEETVDEIEGMGERLRFEITFDGHTEVTERILREQLVLGRGTECDVDVVLQSMAPDRKRISRHHAYIVNSAAGLFVRDNAKNKTWINDAEVAGECALRDGDILRMAGATVKVRIL